MLRHADETGGAQALGLMKKCVNFAGKYSSGV